MEFDRDDPKGWQFITEILGFNRGKPTLEHFLSQTLYFTSEIFS